MPEVLFFGEYDYTLDEKNRLRIPARLKSGFGGQTAVLAKGTSRCIAIHPEHALDAVFEKLNNTQVTESDDTMGLRFWAASMKFIEEDGQGRFVLPQNLKSFAGIDKQVVFIGVGGRVELWAKEVWQAYCSGEGGKDFDSAFNKLSARGI